MNGVCQRDQLTCKEIYRRVQQIMLYFKCVTIFRKYTLPKEASVMLFAF